MGAQLYFDNYSPVGDITVLAMCMAIVILVIASYFRKTKLSAIYLNIVLYLFLAALTDVVYHTLYVYITDGNYTTVYILRVIYHAFLFSVLLLFCVYIVALLNLDRRRRMLPMIAATMIYATVIITDIVLTVTGNGFRLDTTGKAISGFNIFFVGYMVFIVLLVGLMVRFGRVLYGRVMIGFYGTVAISFLVLFMQGRHGQSSFTVVSFLFPAIAMLYLVHADTFDLASGAADITAFEDTISHNVARNIEFLFVSLYLPDFDAEGVILTSEVRNAIRRMADRLFKGVILCQISNGHMIYVAKKNNNPDYKERAKQVVDYTRETLSKYKCDYKIVIGMSMDEISRENAYVGITRYIHHHMPINEVHVIDDNDISGYNEYSFILSELSDIYKKQDYDDKRVRVYCQPVYNIKTGGYDTAETLMRLELDGMGIVAPYKFISLAEESGYIHALTKILLWKTCKGVKKLLDEGYSFKRVSVNLSMLDLKEEGFSDEITHMMEKCDIPYDKVAFEITESLNEYNFEFVKSRVNELKDRGVKFYLDDFGTGFSNMERILELPFDIIKFDRSLVIASDSDERSEKMVRILAQMFSELDYAVLYEGIENDGDEKRCIEMSASYLQGYKYSKPIPFEELRGFFEQNEEN